MKKNNLTILFIFMISNLALAQQPVQWTASGTNIYNINSGNVGIGTGTAAPKTILAVSTPSILPGTRNPVITAQEANTTTGGIYNTVETTAPFGWGLAFDTYKSNVGQIEVMRINNAGNVGIGTTSPAAVLDVRGPAGVAQFTGLSRLGLTVRSAGTTDYSGIDLSAAWGGADNPLARIGMITTFSGSKLQFGTSNNYANGITNTAMTIDESGNVGIGTTDPKAYKLAVNGSVIATAMTIQLNSAWPDYVFKKDYSLPSLSEVKAYIDQNQHLPEIPSEQEIVKNGLNLGDMNKLLVKKVEELTLYLIEKDAQDQFKNKMLENLQQQLDELKRAIKHK